MKNWIKVFLVLLSILIITACYYFLLDYEIGKALLEAVAIVVIIIIVAWIVVKMAKYLIFVAIFGIIGFTISYGCEYYLGYSTTYGANWFLSNWYSMEGAGCAVGFAMAAMILICILKAFA